MNTKTVGRVAPVEPVKQDTIVRQPISKTAAVRDSVERKEVQKTACEHVQPEKTANSPMMGEAVKSFISSVGGGLGGVAVLGAANYASNKINKVMASAEFKKALDKAIQINPRLQQRNRAELEAYLGLISEASPAVARNPLLLANYLEYLIDHQGQINYTAYGDLVNLEGKILSNRAATSPLTGSVQKAIIDSSVRGAFDVYGKIDRDKLEERARDNEREKLMKQYNLSL